MKDNLRGERIVQIALELGFRVYYDFNYCYIKLPAAEVVAKFHLENMSDFMVDAKFLEKTKGKYFREIVDHMGYFLTGKEAQDWPAGYTIVRRNFGYGSTREYDDEHGLVQTADMEMDRTYPKEESVRILMRYRAFHHYVMQPVDPVQGKGMTMDEKYKFIINGGTQQ